MRAKVMPAMLPAPLTISFAHAQETRGSIFGRVSDTVLKGLRCQKHPVRVVVSRLSRQVAQHLPAAWRARKNCDRCRLSAAGSVIR